MHELSHVCESWKRLPSVLLVSTDFLHGGGGHLCLLRHIRRLEVAGFAARLLTEQLRPERINDQFCTVRDLRDRHIIPVRRWFWPPLIHRIHATVTVWRWFRTLEGMIAIQISRPDLLLLHFNGTKLSLWTRWARWLKIPVAVIVYDLRELWPESPDDLPGMEKDSRQVLERADLVWFVTTELQEEYRRRVPGLRLDCCRILPPISGGHVFPQISWRPEFAEKTTVAFTGALKSSCHDVFVALMTGMRRSNGGLILAVQKHRLAAMSEDLAEWEDVVSIRPLHPDPVMGLEWVARNSNCLLVHYSFEEGAEPLSKTSFPSKFQEYSHIGLPILVVAPAETPVGRWAVSRRWPLYLDTLDAEKILMVLQRLKTREFWELCAQRSRDVAAGEFSPDMVHRNFEADIRSLLHLPAEGDVSNRRPIG